MELFVQSAPGLEPALDEELRDLGYPGTVEPGGVSLESDDPSLVARLNLRLSTASRVLVTLGRFTASALPELERKAGGLPWDRFLDEGRRPAFRVTCRKSRLYHTGAVAERLTRAAGRDPAMDPSAPDTTPFIVRIVRDRVVVRADSSGVHLHRRGYRLASTRAPLRETLAAGVLRLAGWDPDRPLVDPLCGSGTFVIEAGLRACRRAPGENRTFAFQAWPGADPDRVRALRAEALAGVRPAPAPLRGSDRDAGAVESATANGARAGVAGSVHFERRAISEVTPPDGALGPGLLVANPPWGRRVGQARALRDLHARLGQVARREFSGWTLALVSPSDTLVRQADRRAECIATIPSGGVSVGVWRVGEL